MTFTSIVRSPAETLAAIVPAVVILAGLVATGATQQAARPAGAAATAIAGTIVNPDGAPMANVDVRAYQRAAAAEPRPFRDGEWELRPVGAATQTNERGQYRIEVEPGDYYIRAKPTAVPTTPRGFYFAEFFPGSPDPSKVNAIHLSAGTTLSGIDFTFRTAQPAQVSGMIELPGLELAGIGRARVDTLAGIAIKLFPIGFGSNLNELIDEAVMSRLLTGALTTTSDGTFSVSQVPPGAYRVFAATILGGQRLTTTQDVYVQTDSNVSLTLRLRPGFDMAGRIRVKGPAPADFLSSGLKVALQSGISNSTSGAPSEAAWVAVKPDGSFVVRDVWPDTQYRVLLSGISDKVRSQVTEIRYGNRALTGNGWLKANATQTSVQVTFDFGLGTVNLQVEDGGSPKPGAYVLLDPRDRGRKELRAQTNATGEALFDEVEPGVYEAFAFDAVKNGDWDAFRSSKAFLDRGPGQPILVEGGQTAAGSIPLTKVTSQLN